MIFLSNAAGEITAAIPETINQGSIGVNKIVLIAPFPASSVVSATFTLPNGIKIYPRYVDSVREENYPYLMGVVEAFGDEGLVIDGVTVNAWQLTLDKAITQVAGKVTVQFLITTASGGVTEGGDEVGILPGTEFVLATTSATLPINRGNAYISPSVAPSQFELIEQYLAAAKLAEENAKTSANTAEEFYMDASAEANRAEAEADRAKLEADRYSPWDVVANQETALEVLNGMANTGLKSYLFLNVDFTELNLNSFINGDGIPQINIANSIEKLEFRGCTFESVQDAPLALKFFYQGSQCSISGAKGDELVIQGFTDVIDCRAALIQDCEYVTACDAYTINDCESVTDTTASLFKECIFVDPFTVIGFVPPEDVGKVATLTDDGSYKPERLAKTIRAVVNPNNYKINIALDDVNGIEMSWTEIDLPLESVVVGATVSDDGTKLILTLQNGNTVDVPIGDIFRGVATEEWVQGQISGLASETWVEDKIEDFKAEITPVLCVYPEMFGAVGDGVTDDTHAIQTAINSADCVKFDATKTYRVSRTIFVKSNTHLEGRGATIYGGAVEDNLRDVFNVSYLSNVAFDNLIIKGDNIYTPYDTNIFGTTMKTSNLLAIGGQEVNNLVVNNCVFDGVTFAIKIDENDPTTPTSHHITIDSCITRNGVGMPIYLGGADDVHIVRCDIDASTNATDHAHNVYISASCDDLFFTNNHFSGGTGFTFNIGTSNSNATPPKDILIHNNICESSTAFMAVIYEAHVTLTSNVITTNALRSFFLSSNSVLTMSGNNIQASNSEGAAYVFETEDTTIRSTSDVIACDVLARNNINVDYEFSNCVITCKSTSSSIGYIPASSTTVKIRLVACTCYTYLTGGSEIGKLTSPQQSMYLDRCTFYNATPKGIAFATNANFAQFYLLNCVFLGFSTLDYSATTTGTVHNTVVLPIATP